MRGDERKRGASGTEQPRRAGEQVGRRDRSPSPIPQSQATRKARWVDDNGGDDRGTVGSMQVGKSVQGGGEPERNCDCQPTARATTPANHTSLLDLRRGGRGGGGRGWGGFELRVHAASRTHAHTHTYTRTLFHSVTSPHWSGVD